MSDELVRLQTTIASLVTRLDGFESRLESVEGGRSGRRKRPMLVSAPGTCGLDPQRDSTTCPDASMYRRNQGCKGEACRAVASEYHQQRQLRNAQEGT